METIYIYIISIRGREWEMEMKIINSIISIGGIEWKQFLVSYLLEVGNEAIYSIISIGGMEWKESILSYILKVLNGNNL